MTRDDRSPAGRDEMKFEVKIGDITRLPVDAIVNAANSGLCGGGGVDGAIHRAAGPGLLAECETISRMKGGCPAGEAVITGGYNLPAKHVIHTVGPVWHGGNQREPELLAGCYKNSMKLAEDRGLRSIAFPNVSTGVYGFPKGKAAVVVRRFFDQYNPSSSSVNLVIFCCYDEENYRLYTRLFVDEVFG